MIVPVVYNPDVPRVGRTSLTAFNPGFGFAQAASPDHQGFGFSL